MLKKFFLGLFAAFFQILAIAQCFEYQGAGREDWIPAASIDAACISISPSNRDASPEPFMDGGRCHWKRNRDSYSTTITAREVECPQCMNDGPTQWTFFSGWGAAGAEISDGSPVPPPAVYCDGSCNHQLNTPLSVTRCIGTDIGVNQKFECTYQYTAIKYSSCSVQNAPEETPPPDGPTSCPSGQILGEVNGVPTCAPDGDTGGGDTGGGDTGGGDGGTGGETGGGDTGGETGSSTGGSGSGSGSGTGTSGTSSGAVTGTGPGGPIDLDIEFPEACGAPGQPKCSVKIDETGTPSSSTVNSIFGGGISQIDGTSRGATDAIGDASSIQLPSWSWTFQIPTSCVPLQMGGYGFEIDMCQYKPMIHDLMSMIWIAAGIFGFIGLFRNAVQ